MDFSKVILLALIAVTGSANCFILSQNTTDEKSKIEGGAPICIDKVPYQMFLKENDDYCCGGALIRPNIVLTAAHCVEDFINDGTKLSVVAGTDSTKLDHGKAMVKGSVEIQVERAVMHPKYDKYSSENGLRYDLAVIKLSKNLPMTKNISTIEFSKVDVKENEELLLTGIGVVDNFYSSSPYLKAYKPKVKNCKAALSTLNHNIFNFDGVICHQSDLGYRSRVGDSGSPLVNAEGKLVAIHTGTYPTQPTSHQVATGVLYHMDWINQILSQYE